jgi:dihydrodipicolinate synthase/N-acetylneuraminate lyase
MLLEGIFPAITTPFTPEGLPALRKLEHNISRYSRTPLAGIVVLGSTGEAVMLSDEESRSVLRVAAEGASPEKVLLAGVARESVLETLRLAEFAAEQRYDAILVRTPHYYGPQMTDMALLTYYRTIADQSALPVILYTIPRFTHLELPVAVVAELAQHPNIIAVKDSTGNAERIAQLVAATASAPRRKVTVTPIFEAVTSRMLAERNDSNFVSASSIGTSSTAVAQAATSPEIKARTKEVGFQVLNGAAGKVIDSFEAGASGSVLAFAACAPQVSNEIYLAWKDRDPALARQKQQRIAAAAQKVVVELGIAGIKYACDLNAYAGGRPRLPLLPLTAAEKEQVEQVMADLKN